MLARIRPLSHDIGIVNAAIYLLSRLVSIMTLQRVRLIKYEIMAQPVRATNITPVGRGRTIDVDEATEAAVRAEITNRPPDVISARLAASARCLIAKQYGVLVGYQWFTMQSYSEDEVRCVYELQPSDHCAWDFDIFVLPEARTRPVFARLWDTCNAVFRAAGVSTSLSRVSAFNGASIRAHGRLGASRIASALFLSCGRLQLAFFTMRPWIHLSLSLRNPPVLAISRLAQRNVPAKRRDDEYAA